MPGESRLASTMIRTLLTGQNHTTSRALVSLTLATASILLAAAGKLLGPAWLWSTLGWPLAMLSLVLSAMEFHADKQRKLAAAAREGRDTTKWAIHWEVIPTLKLRHWLSFVPLLAALGLVSASFVSTAPDSLANRLTDTATALMALGLAIAAFNGAVDRKG